ncbi:unnamed protein product, partial [Didymodactylos carnosus]
MKINLLGFLMCLLIITLPIKSNDLDEEVDRLIAEGLLIEAKPQLMIKDIKNLSTLDNWQQIIKCLIERGLDVNERYYFAPD